ncbi:hypothetical protein VNO77_02455 [Canavalia gladiata]|uniref:Uncharacterized protein n=1 Tax=Canavalia gladiata TaxID=3824 RepID=A0AAN9MV43_CANGL
MRAWNSRATIGSVRAACVHGIQELLVVFFETVGLRTLMQLFSPFRRGSDVVSEFPVILVHMRWLHQYGSAVQT